MTSKRLVWIGLAGACLLMFAGCPGNNGDDDCIVGDTSMPPEIELVYRTVDGQLADVVEGQELPLILPPQGGKVLLVSVRARNINRCQLQLNASLRDECTNLIVALEQRPVSLRVREDGWAEPDVPVELTNYANLPACPTAAAERDIEGEPYTLNLRIIDRDGREVSQAVEVVPVCAQPEFEMNCKCECDGEYVLGMPCLAEPDGGPPPGTCPEAADAGVPDVTP